VLALLIARRMDASDLESGSSLAALSKVHQEVLAKAFAGRRRRQTSSTSSASGTACGLSRSLDDDPVGGTTMTEQVSARMCLSRTIRSSIMVW
jgi:hypothetical protein